MKKIIKYIFLVLLIHTLFICSAHADSNNSTDTLKEAFNISQNSLNSVWIYTDASSNEFHWTLDKIGYSHEKVSHVDFSFSHKPQTDEALMNYTVTFFMDENYVKMKVYNSYYNSSVIWKVSEFDSFDPTNLGFHMSNIYSDLSLKMVNYPSSKKKDISLSDKKAAELSLGEKVYLSVENDRSPDWFRYISIENDDYYSNGIHHVSLMIYEWLYPHGYPFIPSPIHSFSESDKLTENSLENFLRTYSLFDSLSSIDITDDILSKNILSDHIIILKLESNYVIVKGYSIIDNNKFFTIMNPASQNGYNSYYSSKKLLKYIKSTNNKVFILKKPKIV